MADPKAHGGDISQARWESHYDRWGSHYVADAGAHEQQDADILEAVAALKFGSALDVGCGIGGLCIELGKRGWAVTGIDIASNAIETARRMAEERGADVTFLTEDATVWQPQRTYDLVTCNFGLPPQVKARAAVYAMMCRAVSPGGVVLLKIGDIRDMPDPPALGGYELLDLEELAAGFKGFEVLKSTRADAPPHAHFGPMAHRQGWKTVLFMARRPLA
jgi:SAM-dependent methyltransferase